jgi:hypoxanthine phosphoribosyltransferase
MKSNDPTPPFKILLSRKDIQEKVIELASFLNDEKPEVCLCILNGALPFCADLMKHFDFDSVVDCLKVSSYSSNRVQGDITIIGPIGKTDLKNQKVAVIEDMIDTGSTLRHIVDFLISKDVKSITVISLLKRHSFNVMDFKNTSIRVGFIVADNDWLVGYGLDNNGHFRHLQNIYTI